MAIEEIRNFRLQKLKKLQEAGMNPYADKTERDFSIGEILGKWSEFEGRSGETHIAGRVMALRGQGALIFVDLYDGTGKIQALLKKGDINEKLLTLFEETIDLGDFIEVSGGFLVTKRGEKTIAVKDWKILTKSLHPLPEKWHGLQDVEERYRKRYLDILLNPELKKTIELKAKFWDVIRDFFKTRDFLEVETPTLEFTTGGAEARPFKTHHNDFDTDLYLRISVGELWQKRLMAAGFQKTFEIGRAYRNEGTSQEHIQEFTNLEFYLAYADYRDGMKLVRELYITIAEKVFGKTKFTTRGQMFDLKDEWREIDYTEEIKRQMGINIEKDSEEKIKDKLKELGIEYVGSHKERLIDSLWKHCRKQIGGPAFVINHPTLVAPLAKKLDGKNITQMFQPIIAGSEVGRGYSELNDPIDQKERFEIQEKLIKAGDEEAMMPDFEFVEMLEYGMPPTCGFGFGERLFSLLIDKPLRETQIFPLMKPRGKE
ncbi:MAG: lysine--tRNA ligase [Patescibacteria group bacterium]